MTRVVRAIGPDNRPGCHRGATGYRASAHDPAGAVFSTGPDSLRAMPQPLSQLEDLESAFDPERDHLIVSQPSPGVVLIELANPEQRNAMSMPMTAAWSRLAGRIADAIFAGDDIRAVAVTGTGSAFCSGGDTRWIAGDPEAGVGALRQRMEPFYRSWLSISRLDVPLVAGVNGAAVGAGACLALSADIRIASESARFSVPFLRLGMHAGMATTFLLPEVVGVAAARELLLTGRMIDAREMLQLGVVGQLEPADGFRQAVIDCAARIAGQAPLATRLTKQALRDGGFRTLEESIRWEALAQPVTLATADLREGLAAARERRAPRFTGR